MAQDKIIKSGQLTIRRIFFLAVVGGIIVATVALGGLWLVIGYWLITLSLVILLLLVAFDYGVSMDRTDRQSQQVQAVASVEPSVVPQSTSEPRVRRRSNRQVKRRR